MHIKAWKWEGTGNEFILMDRRDWAELPSAETMGSMCDPAQGVGADGVIFFRPLDEPSGEPLGEEAGQLPCAHWEMDYLNADGTRSFCGNGSRALFAFLRAQGWMPDDGGTLLACDGVHAVRWDEASGQPGVELRPIDAPSPAPDGAVFVDTGSPHHLVEVEDVDGVDVYNRGQAIRYSAAYAPGGTNVDFVQIAGPQQLRMRTYERGVEAETRACGTGAVAAAVADFARRGCSAEREISMPGGTLIVQLPDAQPADEVFEGVWLFGAANEVLRAAWTGLKWSLLAWVFLLGLKPVVTAQTAWTDQVQVSVLTGSPGQDLYSAWGHTAIRVYDPGQTPPADWTYNYGTFEFGEGFYTRFMRGELNYRLAKSPYASFLREYMHFERAILEQPLDLAPADARAVVDFLEWNYRPENRVYAYKFFEDNCSSRVLTVLESVFSDRWDPHCERDAAAGVTYRQALRPYMHGDAWIEAGIDFILGPRADRVMPGCGSSFLPDGLMQQLQVGTLDGRLVAEVPEEVLPPQRGWFREVPTPAWARPEMWLWLALAASLAASLRRLWHHRVGSATPRWERRLGKSVQLVAGALGVLLLLMWAFTDHQDTWSNWNLCWASPLLGVLPFLKGARLCWFRWILSVQVVCFLLVFNFVPQFMPLASLLLGWAVWLSLDPWKLPWRFSENAHKG